VSVLTNAASTAVIAAIRAYQLALSPFLGSACRFHPTCSEYAAAAVAKHGPVRGLWLGSRRIARCHPFHPGGLDPVP
jgi:putative membrane protein insertion efficiency factor